MPGKWLWFPPAEGRVETHASSARKGEEVGKANPSSSQKRERPSSEPRMAAQVLFDLGSAEAKSIIASVGTSYAQVRVWLRFCP